MTRGCVLHIGAPKTGSTALEKFLSANAIGLKVQGWTYPSATLRGFGHHDLAFLVTAGYPEWALPQDKSFEQLRAELEQEVATLKRIVLSSENFYLQAEPTDVAGLLEYLGFPVGTVRVVVYLRRQDDALLSWYNQKIKAQGYSRAWPEFREEFRGLWDYASRLPEWGDVFGHEHIKVRPYDENELVGGDICHDFLAVMGLSSEGMSFAAKPVNTRINRDILEFQRQVNRLPLSAPEKRKFREQLMALTEASAANAQFSDAEIIGPDERRAIVASYSAGNAEIARRYLGREQLFDEQKITGTGASAEYSGLGTEALAQILGWLMAKS